MFGHKKNEVEGNWKKLHTDEPHNLYCSSNVIKMTKSGRMIRTGHVVHMGDMRNAYKILVGNCKGKSPLGRHRCRWKNNIKMELTEMGLENLGWINMSQDRDWWQALVDTAINLRVHNRQ
jgi:hypothetical protein